jgi:hypothetical protein
MRGMALRSRSNVSSFAGTVLIGGPFLGHRYVPLDAGAAADTPASINPKWLTILATPVSVSQSRQ